MQTVLLAEDVRSATWRRLSKLLTERLQELRELNDAPASQDKTAEIRGRISEVKRTLALADEASAGADGLTTEMVVDLTAGNASN